MSEGKRALNLPRHPRHRRVRPTRDTHGSHRTPSISSAIPGTGTEKNSVKHRSGRQAESQAHGIRLLHSSPPIHARATAEQGHGALSRLGAQGPSLVRANSRATAGFRRDTEGNTLGGRHRAPRTHPEGGRSLGVREVGASRDGHRAGASSTRRADLKPHSWKRDVSA